MRKMDALLNGISIKLALVVATSGVAVSVALVSSGQFAGHSSDTKLDQPRLLGGAPSQSETQVDPDLSTSYGQSPLLEAYDNGRTLPTNGAKISKNLAAVGSRKNSSGSLAFSAPPPQIPSTDSVTSGPDPAPEPEVTPDPETSPDPEPSPEPTEPGPDPEPGPLDQAAAAAGTAQDLAEETAGGGGSPNSIIDTLQAQASTAIASAQDAVTNAATVIGGLIETAQSTLADLIDLASTAATETAAAALDALTGFAPDADPTIEQAQELADDTLVTVDETGGFAESAAYTAIAIVQTTADQAIADGEAAIQDLTTRVADAVVAADGAITNALATIVEALGFAQSTADQTADEASQTADEASQTAEETKTNVVQRLSDGVPVGVYSVDSSNPAGATAQVIQGQTYHLVASGTYFYGPDLGYQADAECSRTVGDELWQPDRFVSGTYDGADLYVEGLNVDWIPVASDGGGCNTQSTGDSTSDHSYKYTLVARENYITLRIKDSHFDNSGTLTVQVFLVNSQELPSGGPGSPDNPAGPASNSVPNSPTSGSMLPGLEPTDLGSSGQETLSSAQEAGSEVLDTTETVAGSQASTSPPQETDGAADDVAMPMSLLGTQLIRSRRKSNKKR